MNIATTKLELVQQLLSIADEKTLRKVANFFKKEVPVVAEEDDDLTDDEIAELDERRERRISGKSKGISAEDSIGQLRAAQAKDEAA